MSSRVARLGLHVFLSLLLLGSAILPAITADVLAESPDGIIVEDADWVGIDPLEPSPPMPDVSPRVVVEYGGFIRRGGLEGTSALPDMLPRVIVEYGGSIVRNDLQGTTAMPHTSPRVIVTSASSIVHASLTPMTDVPSPPIPFEYPLYHPWTNTLGFGGSWSSYLGHLGEDYAAPMGTPVYAVASGEVVLRHDDPYPGEMKGWGNALIIRHDISESQTVYSHYAHFQTMLVNQGDAVEVGQQIGTIGQTGFATGPHLHLEIKDTAVLGPGFAGYSFTGDSRTHGGVTYYRPSTFIEQYRGFKAGDELAVTGTGGVGLRLRSSPAISSSNILTVMPEGSQVTVIGGPTIAHGYGWWQVQFGGQHGWAAGRYLTSTEGQVAPDAPTGLGQYTTDGTPVPPGGSIEDTRIVLKGTVTSPAGGLVKLQVEVRPDDQGFISPTNDSQMVPSGQEAAVTVSYLGEERYHWRARAVTTGGVTSEWVYFSAESQPDFAVEIKQGPVALFAFRSLARFPLVEQTMVFDASISRAKTAPIIEYRWTLGDGASLVTDEPQVMHVYSQVADFNVTLEVVDAHGLRDQISRTISVGEADHFWAVNRLIEDTKQEFEGIWENMLYLCPAADYFLEEVWSADEELREAAVKGVAKLVVAPFVAAGTAGIVPKGLTVTIGEASQFVANGLVMWGVGEAATMIWQGIEQDRSSFHWFAVQNIKGQVDEKKAVLDDLKYELIGALDALSPEVQEQFLTDIYNRRSGNEELSRMLLEQTLFPRTMYDARSDLQANWQHQAAKDLMPYALGIPLAVVLAGQPLLFVILGNVGVSFSGTMAELSSIRAALTMDQEMLRQTQELLFTAPVVMQMMENNIGDLLEDIRQSQQSRQVGGEIISVSTTVKGYPKLPPWRTGVGLHLRALLWPLQAYSEVTIENTGEETTSYLLYTCFSQMVAKDIFLELEFVSRMPRVLVHEITLGRDEKRMIKVDYLDRVSDKKPEGEIRFLLLAVSRDSIYKVAEEVEKLKTILLDEDGIPIPDEEAARMQILEYPIRWDVTAVPGTGEYNVSVYLLNPLDAAYTMSVNLVLPPGVETVSADDGVVSDSTIYWEVTLEPGNRRILTARVSAEQAIAMLQVTPPVLELYNHISGAWETFPTSETLIPPDMPHDPSPCDMCEDVPVNTHLSWTGGDPQPDQQVTYFVSLWTLETPSSIETTGPYAAKQTSLSYNPSTLDYGTTYYWKIVALNDGGAVNEGPVWRFTTVPGLEIVTELPSGHLGVAYEATLEASGGASPYAWNWTAEEENQQLPPGLDLGSETGIISGIPTDVGTFNFTVRVTDDDGLTASRMLSIAVSAAQVELSYDLKAGWNMVSLPLHTAETGPAVLFPGHVAIYSWNASELRYEVPEELVPGRGYWILYFNDATVPIQGAPVEHYELVDAVAGWHMIGSVAADAEVNVTAGTIYDKFYWWNPQTLSYEATDTLGPGKGYWLLGFTPFSMEVEPQPPLPP